MTLLISSLMIDPLLSVSCKKEYCEIPHVLNPRIHVCTGSEFQVVPLISHMNIYKFCNHGMDWIKYDSGLRTLQDARSDNIRNVVPTGYTFT